jgi:fructokinase
MAGPGSRIVVGIGEALFDLFPEQQRLGGAPLNFAVHAHQLGDTGVVVSRVGQDELGRRIHDELKSRGMPDDHLQFDPDHPTGVVYVELNADGEPTYDIVRDVAWDHLQWDGDLDHLAGQCAAVCFGSLAQRDAQARNTICRFVELARRAVRLFDVNLRQDYDDRRTLARSLELASAVKVNRAELERLGRMFDAGDGDRDAALGLIDRFDLSWLALTRGKDGTVVYTPDPATHEAEPIAATAAGSAVGAGDATSAALLHGVIRRWPWDRTLKLANAIGAFVAGHEGACPELSDEIKALA